MDIVFVPLLSLALFFVILLVFGLRRPDCPACGQRLPFLQSPFAKTRRMWLEGGYRCANCGCEADLGGKKVAPGTVPRRGWVIRGVLLLALLAGLGLYALLASPPAVAPPVVAASAVEAGR